MTQAHDIAELKRKLVMLEERVKPPPIPSEQEAKEWAAKMHASAEARASYVSPEIYREWNVIPDDVVKGIAMRDCHAPLGPSGAGASGKVERVSTNPGLIGSNTTGWQAPTPLGPMPGVAQADRLMDAQDAKDLRERKRMLGER
jgi:hypothetical protein